MEETYVREEESSIAKVRNKIQPIVTYFELKKIYDEKHEAITKGRYSKTTEQLAIEFRQMSEIGKLIKDTYILIKEESMSNLLKLIKDDSIW